MKRVLQHIFLVIIFSVMTDTTFCQEFKTAQKEYSRVKSAYREKEIGLEELLSAKGLSLNSLNIVICIFKKEALLEVWAKDKTRQGYLLLTTYPVCSSSGDSGPKRKEGDGQTPEGFYHINFFNPYSNYYLSLGVSYPNASDKILSDKKHPGGSVFIHGNCVTIGCIPITDDKIKELYILAVEAKNNGQNDIPVCIFPCKMDQAKFEALKNKFKDDQGLIAFWENLKTGYDMFLKNHIIPSFSIDSKGKYIFK